MFYKTVNTRAGLNQNGFRIFKLYLENESKTYNNFLLSRTPSLISNAQMENISCNMDNVLEDLLGPPLGKASAAVIANKNRKIDPLRAVREVQFSLNDRANHSVYQTGTKPL